MYESYTVFRNSFNRHCILCTEKVDGKIDRPQQILGGHSIILSGQWSVTAPYLEPGHVRVGTSL